MASQENKGLLVIGAGVLRTGTMSLQVALETLLGGPCYHMRVVGANPHQALFWIKACKEDPTDQEWLEFFKGYKAAVDFPPTSFYERLMRLYPEAKVVLTVRDPEKWFSSIHTSVGKLIRIISTFPLNLLVYFTPKRNYDEMLRLLYNKNWNCDIYSRLTDHDFMIQKFKEHNERVKRIVPPEKLLVFQASEGWKPLCDFLNVPVPDGPYPRVNSSEDFNSRIIGSLINQLFMITAAGGAIIAAFGVGYWSVSKYSS